MHCATSAATRIYRSDCQLAPSTRRPTGAELLRQNASIPSNPNLLPTDTDSPPAHAHQASAANGRPSGSVASAGGLLARAARSLSPAAAARSMGGVGEGKRAAGGAPGDSSEKRQQRTREKSPVPTVLQTAPVGKPTGAVIHEGVLRRKKEDHKRFEDPYKALCVCRLQGGVLRVRHTVVCLSLPPSLPSSRSLSLSRARSIPGWR
jgi:hypothetical protein